MAAVRGRAGGAARGLAAAGCGSGSGARHDRGAAITALQREARPIGRGAGFHEPVTGAVPGRCLPRLGRRVGVHVELFAADRVALIPGGIGVRGPAARVGGRITRARCYGDLVTLDPTGVVLVRPGSRRSLKDLFAAWGQPLSRTRLAAFTAARGQSVRVYVDGRRRAGPAASVPLARTPRSCSRSARTCPLITASASRRSLSRACTLSLGVPN